MEAIPSMNRSAKDGARSSLHYGGEGVPIHPSYQVNRRMPNGTYGGVGGSAVSHRFLSKLSKQIDGNLACFLFLLRLSPFF